MGRGRFFKKYDIYIFLAFNVKLDSLNDVCKAASAGTEV
jgi:hypothetical protein